MITSYDLIKTLLRTEKGIRLEKNSQYLFQVSSRSNKTQIKKAVEEIYNVKVASDNMTVVPGKRKRVRQDFGHTAAWKKAIVTLKEGQKIEVT